ncbi:MAG: DUF4388 domain-containing protein [Desulfomonile tiedjei]|uniref:DUF4388 domain-containing protein n=1 Tax=Desulfomonile tiedjei TaxID=2358 RepID=A0A9D6UZW8_9BACT|nr:DUF4388 domain-containing protein [Desulfomonile tiedjei]
MMALKGTLEDMAIIDLVQFPHSGRKTGHLIISGTNGEARLSYENGSLVHATLGDVSGMNALVRVVDWNEGTFEFVTDAAPEARTIELDLHRAVMQALKLHDELKEEAERRKTQETSVQEEDEAVLTASLSEFLNSNDFALHACVLDSGGEIRAAVDGPDGPPEGIENLRSALHSLVRIHPRGALRRILLEDDLGTVTLVGLPDGGSLIAVASKGASLGSVSMSVGRLAAGLE